MQKPSKLPPKHLDKTLVEAYHSTDYVINELGFTLKIGEMHPELDQWLKNKNYASWGFITAWNPLSKELSQAENKKRNASLEYQLKKQGYVYFSAEGKGKTWQETSFFVLGISLHDVWALGQRYEQNAVLFGEHEAALIWCV